MQQWSWVQRIYSGAYLPRDRHQILKYWQRSAVYCNCLQRLHNSVDGKDFIYRWKSGKPRLWPLSHRDSGWIGRAAHGWLLGKYSALAVGTYCRCYPPVSFTSHSLFVNCFVALSLASEPCRQRFLGLLSFTLNSSCTNKMYFDSVTSAVPAEEQNRRNREMNPYT